ncbi:FecR domain-containing protein [Arenibacter sp. M-2]|uniref:FecR family protein n=1 Tax=Arenibacter sp. M-2 TaxID=3053612 RepID=UPI0025704A7A|nr:FecR family protein [Arenibacter sp. M-2]MDL5514399.1 FecR domain-containing protein [Arenibacter sp. M-2]
MEKLRELIGKYFSGSITKSELRELESLIKNDANRKEFEEFAKDQYLLNRELPSFDVEGSFANIQEKLAKPKNSKYHVFLKAAAAILLLIGLSSVLKVFYNGNSSTNLVIPENAITIQLEDGTVKILSETESEVITNDKGQVIAKKDHGVINYRKFNDKIVDLNEQSVIYNEISVPLGKKFKLILEDGTFVTINSGSKIRYPIAFAVNAPREVFLDGEAFFEVTKDSERPFQVYQRGLKVEVLGTRFNVNGYAENSTVNTVLIEGSVGLSNDKTSTSNTKMRIIKPGEMGLFNNKSSEIDVQKVDVEEFVAWIDNRLVFKVRPFENILKVLERHFDVKINNEYKQLNDKQFFAKFDNETIEEIFRSFQESQAFEYKVEGREITIYEPLKTK